MKSIAQSMFLGTNGIIVFRGFRGYTRARPPNLYDRTKTNVVFLSCLLREATKKVIFLMAVPLRGGGVIFLLSFY